jgi:hypothetical protein
MVRKGPKTVRLKPEDAEALARAQADGLSSSELIHRGLRIVASRYYSKRVKPPKTKLFVCTDPNLGEGSELYKDFGE